MVDIPVHELLKQIQGFKPQEHKPGWKASEFHAAGAIITAATSSDVLAEPLSVSTMILLAFCLTVYTGGRIVLKKNAQDDSAEVAERHAEAAAEILDDMGDAHVARAQAAPAADGFSFDDLGPSLPPA